MGLMFEGETIEEEYSRHHSTGHHRKKKSIKPYMIIIIVLSALLILALVWGLVIQKKYPNLKISNLFGSTTNTTFVVDETGAFSEWTVMERVSNPEISGFALQLPGDVQIGGIAIENHYRDRALLIRLQGIKAADFAGTTVNGNVADISVVAWKAKDNEILVSFQMSEVWEYEVVQEDGKLLINNLKAVDMYDTIVVIDPIYADSMSCDVTALIAEDVAQKAAAKGIKVYITRGNAGERTEAERLALMIEAEPDFVIELTVDSDTDTAKYGMSAVYNDDYYNPECTNAHVADVVLARMAETARNRANSIGNIEGDSLLTLVKLPAAGLCVGYSSNSDERALLESEGYRAVVADGIIEGLMELVQSEETE